MPNQPSTLQQLAFARDLGLSEFDREILVRLVKGESNPAIADSMCCHVQTVKSHISIMMDKLNVQSRTELAVAAVRAGF